MPNEAGRATREGRAGIALKALAIFLVVLLVPAGGLGPDLPPADVLVRLLSAGAVPAALVVLAINVDRRRPWAVDALPLALAVIAGADIVAIVIGLGERRLQIPVALLVAIWVLRAPPERAAQSVVDWRSIAVIGAILVGLLSGPVSDALLRPGGPLVAGKGDLTASLTIDCGPTGNGVPARVDATYRWSWSRTERGVAAGDQISIGWSSAREPDQQGPTFSSGDESLSVPGITSGASGSPNGDLAASFISGFTDGSWDWSIDTEEQALAPGQVVLHLERTYADGLAHATLAVQAAYMHRGAWRQSSEIASCQW